MKKRDSVNCDRVLKSQKKKKERVKGIKITEPLILKFRGSKEEIIRCISGNVIDKLSLPHSGLDTAAYHRSHKSSETYEMAIFFVDDELNQVNYKIDVFFFFLTFFIKEFILFQSNKRKKKFMESSY